MKNVLKGTASKYFVPAEWAAGYFSITLGMVTLSLLLISMTHKGVAYYTSRSCSRVPLAVIFALQSGMIALAFNLDGLTVEPHILTVVGFFIVFFDGLLRGAEVFFLNSGEGDSTEDEARADLRYWRLIQATIS